MTESVNEDIKNTSTELLGLLAKHLPTTQPPTITLVQQPVDGPATTTLIKPGAHTEGLLDLEDLDLRSREMLVRADSPDAVDKALEAAAKKQKSDEGGGGSSASTPSVTVTPPSGSVSLNASAPNVLSKDARETLAKSARKLAWWTAFGAVVSALVGVVPSIINAATNHNVSVDTGNAGWAAVGPGLVSLTSIVISYLTVMGFKNVEYGGSIGGSQPANDSSGSDSGGTERSHV